MTLESLYGTIWKTNKARQSELMLLQDDRTQWSNLISNCKNTNLISSTYLVFTQYFNACAECHQGLVNIPLKKKKIKDILNLNTHYKTQIHLVNCIKNEQTCFSKTAALCSRSVGALAACQVHQTQLTHIHLVFVLHLKMHF